MTGFYSVDGTKIIASNAKDKNFSCSKLDERIGWLEKHIEEYLRQMDQMDCEEAANGTFTKEELDAKLEEARERLARYQGYRDYMEQNNLSQISLTDADAKLMKNRNGFTVSHNVQSVVDSETHLISDFTVTSSPTDYGQLEPSMQGIKKQSPDKIVEAVADKGYQSEKDMAKCLENGIIPHVILPDGQDTYEINIPYEKKEDLQPGSTEPKELSKCLHAGVIPEAYKDVIESVVIQEKEIPVVQDTAAVATSPFQDKEEMLAKASEGYFVRDPERNLVYCPTGETLRQNTVTRKDKIRYINKTACRHCPLRNQCYQGSKGFKEVEFSKDEFVKPNGVWMKSIGKKPEFHKRHIKKEKRMMVTITLRPDRRKMAQRMCISEHPFGTLKRTQGSSYFLLKGNRKVTGEFALFSLAYNMQRALNLLGFEKMMKRMSSSFDVIYLIFNVRLKIRLGQA